MCYISELSDVALSRVLRVFLLSCSVSPPFPETSVNLCTGKEVSYSIPFSRLRVEGANKYKWKSFSSVMCCTASWTTGLGLSVSFPLYWPITAARASAGKPPNDSCSVFSETPSWHFSNCGCETRAWVQNSNSVSITAEKTMWATRVPWWTQGCLRIWQ